MDPMGQVSLGDWRVHPGELRGWKAREVMYLEVQDT